MIRSICRYFILCSLMHIAVTYADENLSQPSNHLKTIASHGHLTKKVYPSAPVINNGECLGLKKDNNQIAVSQIVLFRSALNYSTLDKSSFSQMFSPNSSPIDIELITEMNRYINRYAGIPQSDEVLNLLGLLHKRTKNYYAAALDWELLKVMYTQSSFVETANNELKTLVNNQLSKYAAMIERINSQITLLRGDRDQRTGEFIEYLRSSREENFSLSIIAISEAFLDRNEDQ